MQDTLLNFGRVRSLVDSSVLRANEGQLFWSATRNWYTVVFFLMEEDLAQWKCMEMYGARKFTYPQVV